MKQTFLSLVALTVLLSSCSKDVETINPANSEVDNVSPNLVETATVEMASQANSTYSGYLECLTADKTYQIKVDMTIDLTQMSQTMTFHDQPAIGGGFDTRTETWTHESNSRFTTRDGISGILTTFNVTSGGSGKRRVLTPDNSPSGEVLILGFIGKTYATYRFQ